jgi:hypothetical protein
MNRGAAPPQVTPAIVVHGIDHARQALRPGLPVVLLSAEGAAGFAGCGWWRALVGQACADFPTTACTDILDCADAAGLAMAALRHGQRQLVLWPTTPGFAAVSAAARALGCDVLPVRPAALDLSEPGSARKIDHYLSNIFT